MTITEYKNIFIFSFKALLHKSILKLSIISLLFSLIILTSILFSFWNAVPSLPWVKVIFWGVFDNLLNSLWFFVMSSLFIFLYPSLSTIVTGFFLETISDKTNNLLGNNYESKNSFLGGVIAGVRILGLSTIIFFIIIILKWFFISNFFIIIIFQLLAAGYIIGKEYYEIVALKIFSYDKVSLFRKKHFGLLTVFGIFCSLLFMIPILNLIAPNLSIIIMTNLIDKLNKNI
jgi:CysZ protein